MRDALEGRRRQKTRMKAGHRFPCIEFFCVPAPPALTGFAEAGFEPLGVSESDTLMVVPGEFTDFIAVRSDVHRSDRERAVEVTYGEHRYRFAVRRQRVDEFGDPCQGDGISEELPTCLMVGMPHPTDPGVSPGDQPVRPDLADQPCNADDRFPFVHDSGIRKIEKTGFAIEDFTRTMAMNFSSRADLFDGQGTERLRLFATAEPDDHDAIPPCPLGQDRTGDTDLVIRVRESDEKCPPAFGSPGRGEFCLSSGGRHHP